MNIDDPKLTAYALNELDEAERAQIEALLASDPDARRQVEEIRRTAMMLSARLGAVPTPSLTARQREEITAASVSAPVAVPLAYEPVTRRRSFWRRAIKWGAVSAAACAALAAVGYPIYARQMRTNAAVAQLNAQVAQLRVTRDKLVEDRAVLNVQLTDALSKLEATQRTRGSASERPARPTALTATEVLTLDPRNIELSNINLLKGDGAASWTGAAGNPTDLGGVTLSSGNGAPQSLTYGFRHSVSPTEPFGTNHLYADDGIAGHKSLTEVFRLSPSNSGRNIVRFFASGSGSSTQLLGGGVAMGDTITSKIGGKTVPGVEGQVQDGQFASNPFPGVKRDSIFAQKGEARDRQTFGVRADDSVLIPQGVNILIDPAKGDDIESVRAKASNESYASIHDNPFHPVLTAPLSTFSIDVDTAAYSNIRRFISQNQLPPADAVRIEEMLNYFPYDYKKPAPNSPDPFAADVEVAGCPWNAASRLVRVAVKGKEIAHDKRPVSNLVFLIDVSGSMNEPRKLPLVKEGMKLLVNEMTENDRVGIVVYAGAAGMVLPSTPADPKNKEKILAAIENLSAGGSTNGGQGVELAYRLAAENFIKGGTNRVILATDGDWNVGITDQGSLVNLIEDKAKSGVFLSLLGFGFGNLKDSTMEKLADKGNGHYAYIDDVKEARKVLVEEMSGTLVTIAKDVKVQIEFNPTRVESYRLIGYENRILRKEDFNNDKIDAGEIGAGHAVTALYEVVPVKAAPATKPVTQSVDDLKYQKTTVSASPELLTLKLRYKQPDGETSKLIEIPATDAGIAYAKASDDFKFAAAVAQFGMILRNSPHKGTASLDGVIELADEGKGKDDKGYRGEFVELVKKTRGLVKK